MILQLIILQLIISHCQRVWLRRFFSQGYDIDGLKADYSNVDFDMEECETYNNIKLGGNDIAEEVVHMGTTENFVLISDADIKHLRVDNLHA